MSKYLYMMAAKIGDVAPCQQKPPKTPPHQKPSGGKSDGFDSSRVSEWTFSYGKQVNTLQHPEDGGLLKLESP
jgi:hypothetical protein